MLCYFPVWRISLLRNHVPWLDGEQGEGYSFKQCICCLHLYPFKRRKEKLSPSSSPSSISLLASCRSWIDALHWARRKLPSSFFLFLSLDPKHPPHEFWHSCLRWPLHQLGVVGSGSKAVRSHARHGHSKWSCDSRDSSGWPMGRPAAVERARVGWATRAHSVLLVGMGWDLDDEWHNVHTFQCSIKVSNSRKQLFCASLWKMYQIWVK